MCGTFHTSKLNLFNSNYCAKESVYMQLSQTHRFCLGEPVANFVTEAKEKFSVETKGQCAQAASQYCQPYLDQKNKMLSFTLL
jgi:hypothetical protein